uniref:Uncharacterized protein n=1 Tax=Brassica oleracea TaxID=3712 RepID=A0A3P6DR29_BRAOL|nr:unnamed protein product [Brassica oleracea]
MSSKERRRPYRSKTACFPKRSRKGKRFFGHNKSNGTSKTMATICLLLLPRSSIKSSIHTCSLISHLLFSIWVACIKKKIQWQ